MQIYKKILELQRSPKIFYEIKIFSLPLKCETEFFFAQFFIHVDGNVDIKPHDYGTWSYKNGQYMECGRKGDIFNREKGTPNYIIPEKKK